MSRLIRLLLTAVLLWFVYTGSRDMRVSILEALALVMLVAVAFGAAWWIVDARDAQKDDAFVPPLPRRDNVISIRERRRVL